MALNRAQEGYFFIVWELEQEDQRLPLFDLSWTVGVWGHEDFTFPCMSAVTVTALGVLISELPKKKRSYKKNVTKLEAVQTWDLNKEDQLYLILFAVIVTLVTLSSRRETAKGQDTSVLHLVHSAGSPGGVARNTGNSSGRDPPDFSSLAVFRLSDPCILSLLLLLSFLPSTLLTMCKGQLRVVVDAKTPRHCPFCPGITVPGTGKVEKYQQPWDWWKHTTESGQRSLDPSSRPRLPVFVHKVSHKKQWYSISAKNSF